MKKFFSYQYKNFRKLFTEMSFGDPADLFSQSISSVRIQVDDIADQVKTLTLKDDEHFAKLDQIIEETRRNLGVKILTLDGEIKSLDSVLQKV